MRIALFTETFAPKVDGIVTRLTHTVRHLAAAGDDVLVVAPGPGGRSCDGAAVHRAAAVPFPLYPELRLAPPAPGIGRAVRRFGPQLIHVVNPAVLGVSGIALAGRLGVPLVASYHTHLPKYLAHYRLGWAEGLCWRLIRALHNRAARNLCTSAAMADELRAHGIRRVELWRRGVDTGRFRPELRSAAVRAELSGGAAGGDGPLLLYVGRLAAEKEVGRIRGVLEAIPGARLALVGDGPARAALERHFAGTSAHFAGYRHGEALAAAFASADALILPSRTETLGLVLLEAMAAGCPVVAARAGGVTDVVADGVTGVLFDPDEPGGVVAATRRLLDGGATRAALGRAARVEAERWGWAAATAGLRDCYRAVLEGSGDGRDPGAPAATAQGGVGPGAGAGAGSGAARA